ncbi:glycosyltransferase family 9 protein [Dyella ginsengisoli]|uniref:Glycosyltransferase family 9 protein n=2 Tax=Dyella ginsengisoli TaxID=363848 RepID=A0ABW8JYS3_9GAMM
MARAAGVESTDLRVRLQFPPMPPTDRPYVVICPHAGAYYKEWSPHRWAPLIANLLGFGLRVYICGAPNRPPIPAPDGAIFFDLDLVGLAGIVAGARAVIGLDSGPLHLADALGVRTIGLFGATHAKTYGPYGASPQLIFAHAHADRCAHTARHIPGGMADLAVEYERITHAITDTQSR